LTIMAIDNSLSKGLERRLRRETDDKRFEKLINVTKNLQRNNRGLGKRSRKNYINQHSQHIHKIVGDSMIDEGYAGSGKAAQGYLLYLMWDDAISHRGTSAWIDLVTLEARSFSKDIVTLPLAISEHAVQRLIQATGSHAKDVIIKVARPHLVAAALVLRNIELSPHRNRFYTEDGVSVWEVIDLGLKCALIMKTYIPSKSLENEHESLWQKYLDDKVFLEQECQASSALWVRDQGCNDKELINWRYGELFFNKPCAHDRKRP